MGESRQAIWRDFCLSTNVLCVWTSCDRAVAGLGTTGGFRDVIRQFICCVAAHRLHLSLSIINKINHNRSWLENLSHPARKSHNVTTELLSLAAKDISLISLDKLTCLPSSACSHSNKVSTQLIAYCRKVKLTSGNYFAFFIRKAVKREEWQYFHTSSQAGKLILFHSTVNSSSTPEQDKEFPLFYNMSRGGKIH